MLSVEPMAVVYLHTIWRKQKVKNILLVSSHGKKYKDCVQTAKIIKILCDNYNSNDNIHFLKGITISSQFTNMYNLIL